MTEWDEGKVKEEIEELEKKLGGIGGKLTISQKILNIVFFIFITGLLVESLLTKGFVQISLASLAISMFAIWAMRFFTNEAKVNHYQLWVLKSIEMRLINLAKELKSIKDEISKFPKGSR